MDGSAFIYRGFYASQGMQRSDGMQTGALYYLARILLKLLREEKPCYFGFMLDGKGKNFRHEAFASYKANRDSTPEGLIAQIDPICRLVKALGFALEVSQGCEADDCIASLAARYHSKQPVVILGADKDLRQCLREQVIMWDPAAKNETIHTLESFIAQTGLQPQQWPDMQAIMGDSSDNIPGVPGIGPKTAEKIMLEYPNLETLRDNMQSLPDKLKNKFEGQLENVFLYRELTRLREDMCQSITMEDLTVQPVDMDAALALFQEFELNSLIRELGSMQRAGALASGVQKEAVKNTKGTQQYALWESPVAPAPETSQSLTELVALPSCAGKHISLIHEADTRYALGLEGQNYLCESEVEPLVQYLQKAARITTPDVKSLCHASPLWRDIPQHLWFDLGLAVYLLNPEEGDFTWPRLAARWAARLVPGQQAPADSLLALLMEEHLEKRLQGAELTKLLTDLELPLTFVLASMEERGVLLDHKALAAFLADVQGELDRLTKSIYQAAGGPFNIRSSRQLAELLFDRLGLPKGGKTRGGQASTDQEALEKLQGKHPVVDSLLEFRKLEKMRSTYLEPLPRLAGKDGRIRTSFNQTATATGRLSSSNPNLQNIPIRGELGLRMRACFTAAPGKQLISADYSQIELRVLAHLSQEPAMLAAFREGADIHTRTACLLYNRSAEAIGADERRVAKTINFGLVYGMGPQALAQSLKISLQEAKQFIADYFLHFSRLKHFYEHIEASTRELGYVCTMTGRRRLVPDILSENAQMRSQARRQAINTVVQGSAADIIKLAMLATEHDSELGSLEAQLLLQVHDELLLEVPAAHATKAAARVAEIMAAVKPGGITLDVPLVAEYGVGQTWAEAH